jgi:hypothetical protein
MPKPWSWKTGSGMKVAGLPYLFDVPDDVLVLQDVVHVHQRGILHVGLALAAGGDLVVLGLDLQPALDHGEHHLAA